MTISNGQVSTVFDELQPGDRIEVENGVVFDAEEKYIRMTGTIIRTEHHSYPAMPERRSALGRANQLKRKQPSDAESLKDNLILLELPDGELVVVTITEATTVHRA